jgi:hypothetical protein
VLIRAKVEEGEPATNKPICLAYVAFALFLQFRASAQCTETVDGGQFCCQETPHRLAHCIDIDDCDNDACRGLTDCSTGYGLCCDEKYSSSTASGDECTPTCRLLNSPAAGYKIDTLSELLAVPNRCSSGYVLLQPSQIPVPAAIESKQLNPAAVVSTGTNSR